jgi:exonuclease VII small subunit
MGMNQQKIVRTVCVFTQDPNESVLQRLDSIVQKLEQSGYAIQTKRVASNVRVVDKLLELSAKGIEYVSAGNATLTEARQLLPTFYANKALSFNVELGQEEITDDHAQ